MYIHITFSTFAECWRMFHVNFGGVYLHGLNLAPEGDIVLEGEEVEDGMQHLLIDKNTSEADANRVTPENRVVWTTVLPTVGRRAPKA